MSFEIIKKKSHFLCCCLERFSLALWFAFLCVCFVCLLPPLTYQHKHKMFLDGEITLNPASV